MFSTPLESDPQCSNPKLQKSFRISSLSPADMSHSLFSLISASMRVFFSHFLVVKLISSSTFSLCQSSINRAGYQQFFSCTFFRLVNQYELVKCTKGRKNKESSLCGDFHEDGPDIPVKIHGLINAPLPIMQDAIFVSLT